jgi:preprotein translocase subunit SecB
MMTEKFKVLAKFIKDMSSETKNAETYIYVKENISKYQLDINITSKALKNKMIEINTIMKFHDKGDVKFKSIFEMTYATIIKVNDEVLNKDELEKIILCDTQIEIYPDLEKAFLNILHSSGYADINFEKKVDFEELYRKRIN